MKKNKPIIFKVSSEEYEKILKKKEEAGFKHLSEFIRFKLLKEQNVIAEVVKNMGIVIGRK